MQVKCPICSLPLQLNGNQLVCKNHHSFDKAKQGYFHLDITNKKSKGDDALMVQGRIRFLNTGAYAFLKDKLNVLMQQYQVESLLDYACGPGYYCQGMDVNDKIGIDLSKNAIKYAASHDSSSHYYVANGFHLPFFDNSFDCILVVFAPNSLEEFKRLLKPNGILVIVTPAANHLIEIKKVLYKNVYTNTFQALSMPFHLVDNHVINQRVTMDQTMISDCFDMTPYRYKTSKEAIDKLHKIDQLNVTCEFNVSIYTLTLNERN